MILDMLGRRCQEDMGKYGRVTLIFDAMSIKSHIQYDTQNQAMFGYVDLGDQLNETDIASSGVYGGWTHRLSSNSLLFDKVPYTRNSEGSGGSCN